MVLTEFLLTPTLTNFRMQTQAWKVYWTVWEEGIVDGGRNATWQWVRVVECTGKGISERWAVFVKDRTPVSPISPFIRHFTKIDLYINCVCLVVQ